MRLVRSYDGLLIPGLVLLAVFFLAPTLEIAFSSAIKDGQYSSAHFDRFFGQEIYLIVFERTVVRSVLIGLLCVAIGYPVAYFIVQQPPRRQTLLLLLVLIPLWMSILIRTYAWMVVLGREGIVNTVLQAMGITDAPQRMMFTTGAVYVAMIQILLPFAIVTCYSAMTEIDRTLTRAANVLGAGPWQAFRQVFLPLSAEGAITGFIIVFMLSMGFFITPALVGGPRDAMVANIISSSIEQLNWGFASVLALMLLAATLVVIVAIRWVGRRALGVPATGAG